MEKLKEISCDPMCGFKVRSHSEEEVIELAKRHLKKVHPEKKFSDKEVRSYLKTVK
jgi:predicted small metal-binding protein